MTPNPDRTCVIQLGRYGDLISVLPILRHIHENHGTPVLMVSRAFADLLDGVSYVEPWVVDLDNSEILEATRLAEQTYRNVVVSQIWGKDYDHPDKGSSFNRDAWERAGFGYLFDRDDLLPVFDRRDREREGKLLDEIGDWLDITKPYVVAQVTNSASSPWLKRGRQVLAMLHEECNARGITVVDIADMVAPRIYDLLGLLEGARMIATIDTAILHLAAAVPDVPCLTITNSSPWFGSEPRGKAWIPADYDDSVEDIRLTVMQMLDAPERTAAVVEVDRKVRPSPDVPFLLHVYNGFHHPVIRDGEDIRKRDAEASWNNKKFLMDRVDSQPDRNARDEIGDPRPLPYLKDVLSHGMSWMDQSPNSILMWTNDDVHLHPDIYEKLRWHVSVHGACSSRRVDFRGKVPAPVVGKPWRSDLEVHCGRDLFAFRRDWLEAHWDEIPDFILGASDFDLCMAALIRATHGNRTTYRNLWDDLHPSDFPTGYVGHVVHQSVWSRPENQGSPSQTHNRRLFREWSDASDTGLKFTRDTNVIQA